MADTINKIQQAAGQMLVQQLIAAMSGQGTVPMLGGSGQNMLSAMEQAMMGQQMLAAQMGSTPGLEMELFEAYRGFSKLAGVDFNPEQAAAQIHQSIGMIKPMLPMLGQLSPQLLRAIGPRAEQMVFAGDVTQALYHQGMTGAGAAE
ncbi:unnamed protein product, partial [marine sediment metagenome]